ncbi:MAG: 3-isopropylmalate dehydrogenase [Clostridiales bacterium]|nr:3-isopropylmalate dehydrogenase [Clostridiales bacterium]
MSYNIAVLQGDGIGPEITTEAIKVLDAVANRFNRKFNYKYLDIGGAAIDKFENSLPQSTIDECKNSDSILLGAVGGPKWDCAADRPEKGLLRLRSSLGLFTNLRPAVLHGALKEACVLKPEIAEKGIDIMVVRELTGGIYFGERGRKQSSLGEAAWDTELYSYGEIKRIAKVAFEIAGKRKKKIVSVDKANVLESSKLWRETLIEVSGGYPDIELSHMYVDNAAMQIIKDPSQFDVLLTSNMFGDILSDEASQVTGSIGMLPSASLGESKLGVYEPIHGSAPDIAGQNISNPIATILSLAMMLKYSFDLTEEANAIELAVTKVLTEGYRTSDIFTGGTKKIGTAEMGSIIAGAI